MSAEAVAASRFSRVLHSRLVGRIGTVPVAVLILAVSSPLFSPVLPGGVTTLFRDFPDLMGIRPAHVQSQAATRAAIASGRGITCRIGSETTFFLPGEFPASSDPSPQARLAHAAANNGFCYPSP